MQLVHVLNRGCDKRKIFLDQEDYRRFVHGLFEFNDEERVSNVHYLFQYKDRREQYLAERRARKLLVDLHAFVLMPNHYHLLLSERAGHGVARFMQKVNAGYTKYFNAKHQRSGVLLQGKYKSMPITEEAHFIHLPYYIHFNPLDLAFPSWRERALVSAEEALDFLASYRWSSHLDYLGTSNFPSVIHKDLLLEFFGGSGGYRDGIQSWLKNLEPQMENLAPVSLEL